jgi:hypothetical protein
MRSASVGWRAGGLFGGVLHKWLIRIKPAAKARMSFSISQPSYPSSSLELVAAALGHPPGPNSGLTVITAEPSFSLSSNSLCYNYIVHSLGSFQPWQVAAFHRKNCIEISRIDPEMLQLQAGSLLQIN